MQESTVTTQLTSLTQWSQEHIREIFESPTDEASMRAVEDTFSKNLDATLNGRNLSLVDIKQSVLSIRKESCSGLKVMWQQTVEVSADSSNRDGSFGGTYFIHGIQRILPGHQKPMEFTRQKTVIVKIQSQCADLAIDSRKITDLAFVAADVQMNEPGC